MEQLLNYVTEHPWVGYLALGVVSLVLSYRSQFDEWAEKNPKVAGLMKVLRGLGLDPWLALQGLSLLFRGRLPAPPSPPADPPKESQ